MAQITEGLYLAKGEVALWLINDDCLSLIIHLMSSKEARKEWIFKDFESSNVSFSKTNFFE